MAARFILFLKGFCMGVADVIPGVSGGTMALILGIYKRLIDAISGVGLRLVREVVTGSFWRRFFRLLVRPEEEDLGSPQQRPAADAAFLAVLMLGIVAAVLTGVRIIPGLLEDHPEPTMGFFFGLVLASVLLPYRLMARRGWRELLVFMMALGASFVIVGLGTGITAGDPSQPVAEPALAYIFLCGAVAISAMILPGISGAFILLLMGQYFYIVTTARAIIYDRDLSQLPVLLVLLAGIAVGILLFSRVLSWLLRHFHSPVMAVLMGLMLGSLRRIWPFKDEAADVGVNRLPAVMDSSVIATLSTFLVGLGVVLLLDYLGRRKQRAT